MEFTITKEQILELSNINAVVKERLNESFPEAFKTELKAGKWYKYTNGNIIYWSKIGHDGTLYGYGFMSGQFKVYEDENSAYCLCNSVAAKYLIEATDKEVEEALIAEAKKRGYKEGVRVKNHQGENTLHELDIEFMNRRPNGIFNKQDAGVWIFMDGIWAEILPEEKKVITKEKALKILAKKLKVSPENIEIQ